MAPQPPPNVPAAVAFVPDHALRPASRAAPANALDIALLHEGGKCCLVMAFASSQEQYERRATSVDAHVELRAEATAAPPQGLACLPSSGASCVLVGADNRTINKVYWPLDPSLMVCELLQRSQDTLPDASMLPPIKATRDRVPRPVPLRQVSPRRTRGEEPKDAVDDPPMRMGRAAGSGLLGRQKGR